MWDKYLSYQEYNYPYHIKNIDEWIYILSNWIEFQKSKRMSKENEWDNLGSQKNQVLLLNNETYALEMEKEEVIHGFIKTKDQTKWMN